MDRDTLGGGRDASTDSTCVVSDASPGEAERSASWPGSGARGIPMMAVAVGLIERR